jgi:hypothetical protein
MTYYLKIEKAKQKPIHERHLYNGKTFAHVEQLVNDNNLMPQHYKEWYLKNAQTIIDIQVSGKNLNQLVPLRHTNWWITDKMHQNLLQ